MEIATLDPDDVDAVAELWERVEGEGNADRELLADAADGEAIGLVARDDEELLVARDDEAVVGYALATERRVGDISDRMVEHTPFDADEEVTYFAALGVAPERREEGIGHDLTAAALERAEEPVVADVWLHSEETSEGLLESFEFTHAGTFESYWTDRDDVGACVECGGDPCTCRGAVYWRDEGRTRDGAVESLGRPDDPAENVGEKLNERSEEATEAGAEPKSRSGREQESDGRPR